MRVNEMRDISQSSAETRLRNGGVFTADLFLSPTVKEFLKIVEASLASGKNYVPEYLCRLSHRNRLIPFLRHPELEIFSRREFVRHFLICHIF